MASHADKGRRAALLALAALALSGCASAPALTTFALSAPTEPVQAPYRLPGLLLIATPTAIETLASDRVVVREPGGALSYLPGVRYAAPLPDLVQARLIETFENANRLGGVARPGDRVSPDYQINASIRAFEIDVATGEARVELSVRAVAETTGRIAAARVVRGAAPLAALDGPAAMAALEAAMAQALLEIVRWAGAGRG